ncbi:MAG: rRNA maturation RNase YbeY [Propionibacteriaceae bacterium]|nr:rRNA maturation RNase YbeY [Propionibacteriaceae bacterium]
MGDLALNLTFELVCDPSAPDVSADAFAAICRYVACQSSTTLVWDVTLALVDDDRLRSLHDQFMGLDTVTDVMTFPHDIPGRTGGDIVVSFERAAEQGPLHGLTTVEEIRFLFVHGLLHLCGWDDRTETERAAMLARQSELIESFGLASGSR